MSAVQKENGRQRSVMRHVENDLCHSGEVLKNRWEVVSKLGAGGFGQIYTTKDRLINNVLVALKVESTSRRERAQLPMELVVLKRYQGFPHAVQLYGAGTHNEIHFIAMQLIGHNLAKLRRIMKNPQNFTLATTMRLAVQCLEALRDLHSLGVIHRDVKPSNFAIGPSHTVKKDNVYVLDFGLSRFQTDLAGNILPPRNEASFQGTLRYCSIATHMHKDLGRKDDLVSYYYMLIEFLKGCLPWRDLTNPNDVLQSKEKYTLERLGQEYPVQLQHIASHLNTLGYADRPSYADLMTFLQKIITEHGIDMKGVWDWDNDELRAAPRGCSDGK